MKRWLSLILVLFFLQNGYGDNKTISQNHLIFNQTDMYLAQDVEKADTESEWLEGETVEEERGLTTGKKRFFQSLLIPGWGQLSNHSYLTAAAFVGIEVFTVMMAVNYNGKGNDKEDEFEAFADAHYDSTAYLHWLDEYKEIYFKATRIDSLPVMFSHKWWPEGASGDGRYAVDDEQQYYEMIGKYQQFYMGWDDNVSDDKRENHYGVHYPNKYNSGDYVDGDFIGYDDFNFVLGEHYYLSQNALDYMEMRDESNDYFKKSKYMISVVVLNHLCAGIEAAWRAGRIDKKIEEATGLKNSKIHLGFAPSNANYNEYRPQIKLTANF